MRRGPVIHRFLDPGDALGEVMFGIIMTLTFTVGARYFMVRGELDTNELIVGAVGCNIAWGIIDAVLFLLGTLFFRSQRARFYQSLRSVTDDKSALSAVADQFGLEDEPLAIPAEERAKLYQAILGVGRLASPAPIRITKEDWTAAFLVFVLVTLTAIPAIIPFLVMADESLALTVSNTVQVVLLFIAGYRWGAYTAVTPWKVGVTVAALGFGMTMLTVILGG
ncbi:VIT1/CCC1 transporter family protein [Dongia sp.]|uniref:VIT1/CCC1 transporter family protein n=1 Tax=Dongia sp. TaxID=1977262 RepID=UPI0037531B2B